MAFGNRNKMTFTKGNFKITKNKEKVFTNGITESSTQDILGKINTKKAKTISGKLETRNKSSEVWT
jgi:filamentous hemagglutinin family protein